MTRVGLVGYGSAGRNIHGPLITRAGLDLIAVATSDPGRAAQVALDLPGARVVDDLDAMLALQGLDVVVLASPSGVHVEQISRAVAAGVPIVVEKPLGVDGFSSSKMVELAEREGVPLTVFQNRRYNPEFLTLAKVVAHRMVGDIIRAEIRMERWRPVSQNQWRENRTPQQGGGVLLDLFSHLIDQAVLLFGEVRTVYAELEAHMSTAEDTAFVSCKHSSGVISHLGATCFAAAQGPWVRLLGRQGSYLTGGLDTQEKITATSEPLHMEHLGYLVLNGSEQPVARVPGDQADFYRKVAFALTTKNPQAAMPVNPCDCVHVLTVIDAARTSANEGRLVNVPAPSRASGRAR